MSIIDEIKGYFYPQKKTPKTKVVSHCMECNDKFDKPIEISFSECLKCVKCNDKQYKVLGSWCYNGVIKNNIVIYIDSKQINDSCIILKEYSSKEEMINDLSK